MARKHTNSKKKSPMRPAPSTSRAETKREPTKKKSRGSDERRSEKFSKDQRGLLKGWKQIAEFLGQPVATAQRWTKTGMPARREGRFIVASPDDLSAWLGREAGVGQPVHIATDNADLSTDLRRALADARHHRRK